MGPTQILYLQPLTIQPFSGAHMEAVREKPRGLVTIVQTLPVLSQMNSIDQYWASGVPLPSKLERKIQIVFSLSLTSKTLPPEILSIWSLVRRKNWNVMALSVILLWSGSFWIIVAVYLEKFTLIYHSELTRISFHILEEWRFWDTPGTVQG